MNKPCVAMNVYVVRVFSVLCLLVFAVSASAYPARLEQALKNLDESLARRDEPLARRHAAIDSLKRRLPPQSEAGYKDYAAIADCYRGLSTDSAMIYYHRAVMAAENAGDSVARSLMLVDLASQLSKSALFVQAKEIIDTVSRRGFSDRDMLRYYITSSDIFIDAAGSHTIDYLVNMNVRNAVRALDSVLVYMPDGVYYRLIEAQRQYLEGKPTMALGELNEAIEAMSPDGYGYAIAAALMAKFYKDKPEKIDEYLYYLTISADADVRNANGESVSLMNLGKEFFRMGDLDRAFRYLSISSEAINLSGAKVLYSDIAPTMLVMVEAMQHKETRRRHILVISLVILAIVLIACGVVLWMSVRRNSMRRNATHRLEESVMSRDVYIGQLLELCSVYVEGLEEFNRLVGRKLKANQTQDLYKLVESGKVLADSSERFFGIFDAAVLRIFPDFVAELNALLIPDRQVALMPDGRLSPELRIVAFMRMGVTDSNRLSKFLGLSLNTVYTYRNRMRNRARNRDTFESEVMKIGRKA